MTQDVYMGRQSVGGQAALALDAALRDVLPGSEKHAKSVTSEDGHQP